MNQQASSLDRITYAGIASYVLLTTVNIDDANFLLSSNRISLPIIEVNISLDWFGVIAPLLIFIAFAIYYELKIINIKQKEYGSFHEIRSLPDWVFLLLSPLSLFAIFVRYSDYQSKFYFCWHLLFFLICSLYVWNGVAYKVGFKIRAALVVAIIPAVFLVAIAFDVIFMPNKYSATLWLAKNTTLLYRDGDRTVWFLPNISISRQDFLLDKLNYKNSEEFFSKFATSDIGFVLNKASTLGLYDRNLKYLQLPNQVIPFLRAKNVDFTGANFVAANFAGAYISGSKFDGADLSFADFRGAQIFKTEITQSLLGGANFRGAFLGHIKGSDSSMAGNTFEGARIQFSTFENMNFVDAKFSGARLIKVIFKNIDLPETQYVFEGSFLADEAVKIEFDDERAFLAFENAFCGKRTHLLNHIEIHRVLQIKKFESKEAAEEFEIRVRSSKKCKQIAEYYSESSIDMFDYFRE